MRPADPALSGTKESRGHALVEVLVAAILLAIAAGYIASGMINTKRLFRTSQYQYVAVNLARDVLEFGESSNFYHDNGMTYRFVPGQGYVGIPGYYDGTGSGHQWSGWYRTMNLDDIKIRGLVPKQAPDSVEIVWDVVRDPNFGGAFHHSVQISWEEDGIRHRRDIGTISLTQNNDQLHLSLSEFTWRSK